MRVSSLAGAAMILMLSAAPSFAGYYFESTTTTQGEGVGRGAKEASVHAWVDGGNAKVEFQDRDASGLFRAGSYLLSLEGSSTMYVVNPEEQTIAEINLDQMFAMASSIMQATGGLMQMSFSDFSSDKLDEGPGDPILGHATMRYKYRTAYTMSMRVLGIGRETRTETENEFWCTDEVDAPGFYAWLRPDRFRTGNAEMDDFIRQQYSAIDCLPLRMNTVTHMASGSGRNGDSTSTMSTEVTVLREEAVPGSTFELPAGYTSTSLTPDLSSLGSPGAEQDDGNADAADSEDNDNGHRRPRLRDLFKR